MKQLTLDCLTMPRGFFTMKANPGHLVRIVDQTDLKAEAGDFEGFFLKEGLFNKYSIKITKIIQNGTYYDLKVNDVADFYGPRFVPIFIREMSQVEKLLYSPKSRLLK